MKRQYLKKSLGLLLAAVMVLGLAACSNKEQSAQTSGTDSAQQTTQGQKETEGTAAGESNAGEETEITYPLDTEDTFTLWSAGQIMPSQVFADYTESPFHTGLAEKTGVEVEWQFPAKGADINQAYNLLLTEEVLPDIIFKNIGDADTLIDDGVIWDLTEYLPKYAPDYWAYINAPENGDLYKAVKTDKGRYFNVGMFIEEDYNATYTGPVIRQDWLDECGLEAPVTLEDWENVLVTFKEKYNATFSFFRARLNYAGLASGTGAYGSFGSKFYLDDGKVKYAQTQPEWKEYMEVLHRWYEMGLIDKDTPTMDDALLRTKVLNNEVGVSYTAMSQMTAWTEDAERENTGAKWVGIEYPRTEPGAPTCMIQSNNKYYGWGAAVTTSCPEEKLITALKWLNYGYTQEGIMYWNYGEEGVSYKLDEKGVPQWTDLVLTDPNGLDEAAAKYTGTKGTGISIQQAQLVRLIKSPNAVEAVYKWVENTEVGDHFLPILSMSPEEAARSGDILSGINTRVEEMGLKYMTGDESLDNFDAFVAELEEMGLNECLEIYQAAYDRYLSR
jgi:putative aldouronate transport system substrate-binding protein